jgi:hypothetical protein
MTRIMARRKMKLVVSLDEDTCHSMLESKSCDESE